MSNETALTVAPSVALTQAGAPQELVRLAQLEPELARRAMAIIMSMPVDQWHPPLNPARAIAAVLYEQQTGQVCGRDFFADNKMGLVPGYRGRIKEASDKNITDYIDDYRTMRGDERAEHGLQPGDDAVICELTLPHRHKMCREAGIPFKPIIGIGIVRASEKINREGKPIALQGGYTWNRKARNRALKDALSHAGYAATAREVIEDAQLGGYNLGLDEGDLGKLDRDQAVYVTKRAADKEQAAKRVAEAAAEHLLSQVDQPDEAPEEGEFIVEDEQPEPEPAPAPAVLQPATKASGAWPQSSLLDMPDEQHAATAPAEPSQPRRTGSEPAKQAILRTPAFAAQVRDFHEPYYMTSTGTPDTGHILASAARLGYPEITNENLAGLWQALKQHAAEQAALRDAPNEA